MPFAGHDQADGEDDAELILNRTWRPQLAVTGMDGYPLPENGGNVLLPYTTVKLSLRLPPTCDARKRAKAREKALEARSALRRRSEFDGRAPTSRLERAGDWRRGWRSR